MPFKHRRFAVVAVLAVAALLLLIRGFTGPLGRRTDPQQLVLERRLRGLERLLATPTTSPLVSFDRALVVVDERLVRNLLAAVVPYEGTVAWAIKLSLTSAEVFFEDGTALVRLDGTARLGAASADDPLARIQVFAELAVVDLDPELGVLRTRLQVIAVDAQEVNVPLLSSVVERLIENVSRLKIESFEGLRFGLEIPVRLGNELRLPEIGAEGEVHIAAATIPLRAAVQEVRAFRQKLWVSVDVVVAQDSVSVGNLAPIEGETEVPLGDSGFKARAVGETDEVRDALRRVKTASADTAALRSLHGALHDSLEARIARDAHLAPAVADSAEIALALREGFITDLLSEAARRYFDRIEIDLDPRNVRVEKASDLKVQTRLGEITAGRWRVNLQFHKLRGILRASRPTVTVTAENRVHVVIPTVIESGTGAATLRFFWKPKGLGNLVCRQFETKQEIDARILPREYLLSGDFLLSAGSESIVADPEFPEERFPVCVEPSPETWRRVMAALESQDDWTRCGAAMDPQVVAKKLASLCEQGFKVKLPKRIFRTAVIPASLVKSVVVGRSRVALSIRPNRLRVSPGAFWYSASFATEIVGVAPSAPAVP